MKELKHVGYNLLNQQHTGAGGIGTYTLELLGALAKVAPELKLTAFINSEFFDAAPDMGWPGGVDLARVNVKHSDRARRMIGEQLLLPREARKHHVDLLHSVGNTGPLFAGVPHVLTLHDVNWVHHPDTIPLSGTVIMRLLIPPLVRKVDRIIADSNAARSDICDTLHLSEGKVDVVYVGCGTTQEVNYLSEDDVRRKFSIRPGPLVLSVSGKRPHKNLSRMIDAFAESGAAANASLVLPGPGLPGHEAELRDQIIRLGIGQRVKLLGWLNQPDLEGLYRAATCFIFPSLREGFGLPILEAMQRGVPVACSNVAPLPEIGGDAAVYFDPLKISEIAGAIELLLIDSDECERLKKAGLKQVSKYSWERAAAQTIEVYKRALNR